MMKKNIETGEKLQRISQIYAKNNIIGTKTQNIIEKKMERLRWLNSFAEVVSRKASFEEVRNLIEKADLMQITSSESFERQYLEWIIQSSVSFLQQQKKFLIARAQLINSESQSFQDAFNQTPNVDEFEVAEQLFSRNVAKVKDLIQKRLTLSELEALFARAKRFNIDFSGILSLLEAEIHRVKNWQSLEQPSKISEFVNYVKDMCSLPVFFPEMLSKLDQFNKSKKLQLRLCFFLKVTQNIDGKKDKNSTSTIQQSDAVAKRFEVANDAGKTKKIDLKQAKDLKQQIESQEIKFEDDFQQLKDKIKHCEILQLKIQKSLEAQLEPNFLKSLQKDAEKAAFTFSELEEIQEKVTNSINH